MALNRASLREQIRDALLRRILDGTYAPGERLVELQLAAEFGSSQAPVREALRELEALQYVESVPNRGARVRSVTPTEMRDAYRVRAALERLAAEAAARGGETDTEELRALAGRIEEAAALGDPAVYARHDEAFHRRLVEAADNPILLRHWELLLVETRVLVVLRSGIVDARRAAAEHRTILEAVEAGDAARAGATAFAHADAVAESLDAA